MIQTVALGTITASGSAGSATGSATTDRSLNGLLLSIGVAQGNTPHANTDITISYTSGIATRTLLTLTNYATTTLIWYNVRELQDDTAGADISNQYTAIPLDGRITASVAQGGSAATCNVYVVYDDGR